MPGCEWLIEAHGCDAASLADPRTLRALFAALIAALDAGQKAGGDTRGMQSAAMIIVKKNGGVWLNNDVVLRLQVDDNPEPLKELRRLVDLAAKQRDRIAAEAAREKPKD